MRLSGYQPQYFPRLHYIARALDSDVFALSDNVQFVRMHSYVDSEGKRWRGPSYQAHALVKSGNGEQQLAVHTRHGGLQPINKTVLDYQRSWARDHVEGIRLGYTRAPHGSLVYEQVSELLARRYVSLAELNIRTLMWALAWILGDPDSSLEHSIDSINELLERSHPFRLGKIVVKSQAGIAPSDKENDATDRIIATCRLFDADEYYVGETALSAYLDQDRLARAGIKLVQQRWVARPYHQQFSRFPFIPNLSVLDLLANEDQAVAQRVLRTREN